MIRNISGLFITFILLAPPLLGNGNDKEVISLNGPRIGVTYIAGNLPEVLDTLGSRFTSQFGYYFEYQFTKGKEIIPATQVILLFAGMEKGIFLPSLSWVVGFRTANGIEIGMGPNVVPYFGLKHPFGYTIGGGVNYNFGKLHIPLNVAIVLTRGSQRITFLTGFSGEVHLSKTK